MHRLFTGAIASLFCLGLVGFGVSGCSKLTTEDTTASQLAHAIEATQAKIAAGGAIATATTQGGLEVTEVYDATDNGGLYVNDSVLIGLAEEFKQISRQAQGNMKSFEAFKQIAISQVGEIVYYASADFEVLENKVSATDDGFMQVLKVHDVYGTMGTFSASLDYKVDHGLITNVKFDKALFNKSDPEEVCLYYPTNCINIVNFNFNSKSVTDKMREAFTKYEVAQNLFAGTNQQHFENIMRKMDSTLTEYKSWTTVNADKSSGTVFDATRNLGVIFDHYGDPTKINGLADLDGHHGPDLGFVSGLFFDTTDGGSTYFYGPISFDPSTETYSIYDGQNSLVANLHFEGNKLVGFNNNTIGSADHYSMTNRADSDLLNANLAKVLKK